MGQEKEYKEALEAFNEKNKEKAQLVTTLMEVTSFHISPSNISFLFNFTLLPFVF